MLNTLPPSAAPVPRAPARRAVQLPARHTCTAQNAVRCKCSADMTSYPQGSQRLPAEALPRRRGGQPSNRNAFHHGLYAAKNQTPLTSLSNSIPHYLPMQDKSSGSFRQVIRELQEIVVLIYRLKEEAETTRIWLGWDKLAMRTIKKIIRLKFAWSRHLQPMCDLQFVSQDALAIIRFNFQDYGITRDADSFRDKFEKSDLKSLAFQEQICSTISDPPYPFITPRQWSVIEPLLPPPDHACRRGRPPADPRELLDAVFWKFAHHAHWQDLPDYYPPMLTCRRYYRRLFLSGRLTTLYSALYEDFLTRGKADLTAFVEQGCFTITKNKLSLGADLDETWQMRTALLFIQQGYQVFRRFKRETKHALRHGFPSYRIPVEKPLWNPPVRNEADFSFTPIDLANPGQTPQMMMNLPSIPNRVPFGDHKSSINAGYSFRAISKKSDLNSDGLRLTRHPPPQPL